MKLQTQLKKLPLTCGVYIFKDPRGRILYVGKASSLRIRVSSYFQRPLESRLQKMVSQIARIDYQKTDSVIEALLREASLIRRFQPQYNVKLKDDKTFVEIVITQEDFPRIFLTRPTVKQKIPLQKVFGPYPSAKQARAALEILRKIIPFRGEKCQPGRACFYYLIKQCPGTCVGKISKKDYQKIVRQIILFLEGKKGRLVKSLEKEMREASAQENFEKAAKLRDQIFALKHIQDVALIREEAPAHFIPQRIEAYDISNISGKVATGSLVVFTDGEPDPDEYRRFKIKTVQKINDLAMLQEIIRRRLRHREWTYPDLIIIDGGKGQLSAGQKVLAEFRLKIPLVAIAKGPRRKGARLFFSKPLPELEKKLILSLRDEAHRFAIKYHRLLRKKAHFR